MEKKQQTNQLPWTFCILTALTVIAVTEARKRSAPEHVSIGGLANHTVHLACNLPVSNPPNVQWYDEVYNAGIDPQLIYSSPTESDQNNQQSAGMNIDSKHVNRHNFRVSADYGLTISHLKVDSGPGKYYCQSTMEDGQVRRVEYQLTVIEMPVCSGETEFQAGDAMSLKCVLAYSGATGPTVEWYRSVSEHHKHHDAHQHPHLIDSVDDFDILDTPLARKYVTHKARPIDDGSTYRCKVSVGELKKECHKQLTVEYYVQDVKITPAHHEVFPGDVIRCSANGNPAPSVELQPAADDSGAGWKSFVVGSEYSGKELLVRCTASNTLNDVTESITKNLTYHVLAPTQPAPAPTQRSHGHHKHEQVPHNSHPTKAENVLADAQPVQKQEQATNMANLNIGAILMTIVSILNTVLLLN